MFKRILFPTDFSEVSRKAMNFVKKLKDSGTREVIVFHAIDSRNLEALTHYSPADLLNTETILAKIASEETQAIAEELKQYGFTVKILIENGIPFREILKAEDSENVSAIVIGSHGTSNIKEMFLGSVSEKVIRKAKKPVIVIKR